MKAVNTNTTNQTSEAVAVLSEDHITFQDFKNALLIVSVVMNAFVFTAWLALQLTDRYNVAVTSVLFN